MIPRKQRRAIAKATGTAFIAHGHTHTSKRGFRRLREHIEQLNAAHAIPDIGTRFAVLATIPQYESRGHSRKTFGVPSVAGKVVSRSKYPAHSHGGMYA